MEDENEFVDETLGGEFLDENVKRNEDVSLDENVPIGNVLNGIENVSLDVVELNDVTKEEQERQEGGTTSSIDHLEILEDVMALVDELIDSSPVYYSQELLHPFALVLPELFAVIVH